MAEGVAGGNGGQGAGAGTGALPNAGTSARIPEDAVERLRLRIGIPVTYRDHQFHSVATVDNIRHYANGYGDDNRLWCDPEYAAGTQWGTVLGPPTFPVVVAGPYPTELSDEQRKIMKGGDPLAGINAYFSGVDWEWWAPIRPGDRVRAATTLTAVGEKHSQFADRTVLTWYGSAFVTESGTPLALRNFLFVNAARDTARSKGKYTSIERTFYDEALLGEIDAAYANEQVRGAEPRAWEDVRVGDEIPRIVRGPLLIADIIAWHMGLGPGGYRAILSTKLAYKNRQRIPKFYTRNEMGVWDSAQRCHWEDAWAREVGHPFAYDYGAIRDNWLITAVTNWMGDNAWLWKFRSSIRRFNYQGDTHWITGAVVDKDETDGRCTVTIELSGVNQRGETTIQARADVVLPRTSRDRIQLPSPPGDPASNPLQLLEPFLRR